MATSRFKKANADNTAVEEVVVSNEEAVVSDTETVDNEEELVATVADNSTQGEVEGDVVVEDVITDEAEKEEKEPEVTFDSETTGTSPVVKNVKICTKIDHTCSIGGVRYHFVKGKHVNVPANVKSILKQADLLMPL